MPTPAEFKLTLDGGPGRWQVRSDSTATGQCEPVGVTDEAVNSAVGEGAWLLKEAGGAQEDLARAGYRLFCRFFPGRIADSFHNAASAARGAGPLRLNIQYRLTDPRMHAIPWELLFDRAPDRASGTFLALSPDVLLARYVLQEEKVRDMGVDGPLRVLHASAGPADEPALDFTEEWHALDRIAAVGANAVELSPLRNASAAALRAAVAGADRPPHVAIFSGHGAVLKDRARPAYALLLERDGATEVVTDRELIDAAGRNPELRVVVLNACESGNPLGAVPLLAEMNVPAVIGYRANVYDAVAVKFARALYDGILTKPIDAAVRDARLALANSARPLDWTLPILFLRCNTEPSLRPAGRQPMRGVEDIPGHYDPRGAAHSPTRTPTRPTPPASVPPPPAPQSSGNPRPNVTQKGKLTITIGEGTTFSGKVTVNRVAGVTSGTVSQEGDADVRIDKNVSVSGVDFSVNEHVPAALEAEYQAALAGMPGRPID